MSNIGAVHYPRRYRQMMDFSGLAFERGITPTDVDGVLDFNGRLFVFLEFKFNDAPLPTGQRLCLERLCDGMARGGIQSAVIVGRHQQQSHQMVAAHDALVSEYRWLHQWRIPHVETTVHEAITKIRAMAT